MPTVTLEESNRLSLPAEIVSRLGLTPGSSLKIEVNGEGRIILTKLQDQLPSPTALNETIHRRNLETPIQYIKGVGPKLAGILARKGISTVEDALYLLPSRYEDRRKLSTIEELTAGTPVVFAGEVVRAGDTAGRGGRRFYEAVVKDRTGEVVFKWFNFNARYMKGIWREGRRGIFSGEVVQYGFQKEIHHPDVEWIPDGMDTNGVLESDPVNFGRIVPVYPLTEGLNQKTIRKILKEAVDTFSPDVTTFLPVEIMERHGLVPIDAALRYLHFPDKSADLALFSSYATPAQKTLSFDEFFFLQLGLAMKKRGADLEEGIAFQVTHKYTRPLINKLPFSLTNAQKRVLTEIKNNMAAPHPMHRLVQGDVGSGKTIVALLAALLAVENGYQVAIMAPTEILAEQHYLNIHRYCEELGIKVCLLTSGLKGNLKKETLDAVACGDVSIVVGTHAVIQDKVEFFRLGLGIIDEQHRFGVMQRGSLKKKGEKPDILVMTATPIPRTLAMTLFGDLSLSVIDELPPGRTPIGTRICRESQREQVYRLIREEVRKGRQAYIIYPLVEQSEKLELKAAVQMAEHFAMEVFPDLRIGSLHGRMRPEEKEVVMRLFKERQTDILVATTVIEVGIDVPNATVMVVEHAERFGLSQLHQLRGRVGRGSEQSRCILLAGGRLTADGEKRLKVMEETTDGFRIAEADLEIRGPGDFLGTRQAGLPDLRTASLFRDGRILEEARKEAFALIEKDPELAMAQNVPMRQELIRRWGGRLELAGIA